MNRCIRKIYVQNLTHKGFLSAIRQCSQQTNTSSADENKNLELNVNFVNRNPRNLEMLRIARKPKGYHLDTPTNSYWYRLEFEQSYGNLSAKVVHFTGREVVAVSANEAPIRSRLYKCSDASAALNIGRILARRCLQSGITEVHTELTNQEESSEKLKLFLTSLREGGVRTEEPSQIREEDFHINARKRPTLPWEVTEEEALDTSLDRDPESMHKLPEGKKFY